MRVCRYSFVLFFLILLYFGFINGGMRDAADSVKVVTLRSVEQKIIDRNKVLLSGDVEILVDQKIHIWADRVEVDREKEIVSASSDEYSFVKFENQDFVMLSDSVVLDLDSKTGSAKNIKIHVKDGFISAEEARKVGDRKWKMRNIVYTSCDYTIPHWSFTAQKATLRRNSFLIASGLLLKMGDIPVFAFPALAFPLQKRAGSGFLIPRFSFDTDLGFGFRQEYYHFISSHCDTTLGFNFLEKKGFVLSDEFRWAGSPENFLIVNSNYAEEWNAFLEKSGQVVSATDKHYWVQGKYFQPIKFRQFNIYSLIRFDFGTDKKIGYYFFNNSEAIEDSFFNTLIERYFDKKNFVQFVFHKEDSLRRQFVDLPNETGEDGGLLSRKKQCERKVSVSYFPHIEWSINYFKLLSHLFYRHDFLLDYAFLQSKDSEKLYVNSTVNQVISDVQDINYDTARFFYKGIVQIPFCICGQQVKLFSEPYFQLRSKIKNYNWRSESKIGSHCKFFVKSGFEWALPEVIGCSSDCLYSYHMQPLIRWSYLPKLDQDNWYHMDKWDRLYPENRIEILWRNSWKFNLLNIDLYLNQGYDFYNKSDIFHLERCYNQNHLLPFKVNASCSYEGFNLDISQEYSWQDVVLIQSEIAASLSYEKYSFYLGYLYQKEQLQKERGLLSDISSCALIGFSIPVGKRVLFHYDGNFYSDYKHAFPIFNHMKPTLHRIRLEYEGHCWSTSLGFEEKRYRQYGNWKSEHAITFSLKLESVGSFIKKFKRPIIHRAPAGYEA